MRTHLLAYLPTRLLVVLLAVLLAVTVAVVLAPAASAATCSTPWGSLAKGQGQLMQEAPITAVRAGRHECYDRVVLDMATVGGWQVSYVNAITGIATGDPIAVAGGARLLVVVRNPAGRLAMPGVAGFSTLRQVVNAGSFEGVTELGVGVRARLPFRVFVLPGQRLVLDVAHRW